MEGRDGRTAEQAGRLNVGKDTDVSKLQYAIVFRLAQEDSVDLVCVGAGSVYRAANAVSAANSYGKRILAAKQLAVLPRFETVDTFRTNATSSALVLNVRLVDVPPGKADLEDQGGLLKVPATDDITIRRKFAGAIKQRALDEGLAGVISKGAPSMNRLMKGLYIANEFLPRDANPAAESFVGIPEFGDEGRMITAVVPQGKIEAVPA